MAERLKGILHSAQDLIPLDFQACESAPRSKTLYNGFRGFLLLLLEEVKDARQ